MYLFQKACLDKTEKFDLPLLIGLLQTMRHRKSTLLLFCLLLLFIFSSRAFCQTLQIAPIRGAFSADSGKAGTTKVRVPLHPARIAPSPLEQGKKAIPIQQPQGPLLSPSAEEPWVEFHLSATQAQWNIRKPGEYAAQAIVGSIISNVDILINFSGFKDLNSSDPPTQNVEAYYGVSIGNQGVEEVDWVRASDFNARALLIKQNPTIPTYWSLWNKVCVKAANSAFEYLDDAVITFGLQNTNPWFDTEIATER